MAKATTMGPMKIKESASYRVFKVFNAIILTLISVAMLYPFLYLVAQSFSSTQAIVAGQVGLIPKDFNISTYKYVITDGKFIPYYGNTIVYSIIGTVCALLFSALLAYPLSKAELYGGKAINKFIIFTMYFSGGMIPNYILMVSLGLRDTVASFILPGMISTYYVILMRSFFLTLPRELEEAGEIDGLDLWGVFWRIAIPLSKPIIATMTLFYVVQYWNDWFDAFLYLDTTTKWPVAYYLRQLINILCLFRMQIDKPRCFTQRDHFIHFFCPFPCREHKISFCFFHFPFPLFLNIFMVYLLLFHGTVHTVPVTNLYTFRRSLWNEYTKPI